VLERAGADGYVPEPMPLADLRVRLPMRDGVRLDTCVWLPIEAQRGARVPAILLRTPYKESVMGFRRLGVLRYVEAGYAVVIQQIRGIGASEGRFAFNSPSDAPDGHDTVEWAAAQPWCDGAVGMDGSSYVAMTQLTAASARPPHLRCIVPAVPSVDFFAEVPYRGGAFTRLHSLNWSRLIQIDSLRDLTGGFMSVGTVLSRPEVLRRALSRPAIDAAEGFLHDDFLAHYREPLAHPTLDDWWRERMLQPDDYASIAVPALLVSGNFDLGIGTLTLWRALEAHAPRSASRTLVIGPWDHGQCYAGGAPAYGPYDFGGQERADVAALRLAFFDRHLKGLGAGPALDGRVNLFITGANVWRAFDDYPPRECRSERWYLHSRGQANGLRGDGVLSREVPVATEPADRFVDDPELPFVGALAAANEATDLLDLRERTRHAETLVYGSAALASPLTLLGEPAAEVWTTADAPDADLVLWLAELRADGRVVKLAHGQLRLRYHRGFDRETPLLPGEPVRVQIPLTYVAHRVPAGSRLLLLAAGSDFPFSDPNPHTGEPVATAVTFRAAVQTVFHDRERPSSLTLPVLP
jgi:putative CocE/NonD family hydrolase